MTWFKVSDKLHSHRKTMRATADDVAAMGLWMLAGSWCSDQLTDGFVPQYAATKIDPHGWQVNAARLVAAGLWVECEQDGEQGWQFHDFLDDNPSRAQVLAERAATKARQQRWRDKAKSRHVSNGVTNVPGDASATVYPTRPDPPLKGGGERAEVEGELFPDRQSAIAHIRAVNTRPKI